MARHERIPLLKDHHNHPSLYGAMRTGLDLREVRDKEQAVDRLHSREEEFIFAFGWNDSLYRFDERDLADLPPVCVVNTSLHSFQLNTAARKRLADTHPRVVGRIDDQSWVERNLQKILKLIVEVRGCDATCLAAFYDSLVQQGVWYAEEMLLPNRAAIEAVERAELADRTLLWADPETFALLDVESQNDIHGIKLFTDGALGARTAAMVEPLLSGETGILLRTDETLRTAVGEASDTGKSLAVHAVGDRALEQILDALEDATRNGVTLPRVRLEHCQFTTRVNARRVKALGAILSMQPNFSIETLDYSDRLPAAYCALNNPFRRLIDEDGFVPGEDLILGSDGMPHGAQLALEMSLFPPLPSQQLTLDEFVAGYCMPDHSTGSIELGIDNDQKAVRIVSTSASVPVGKR